MKLGYAIHAYKTARNKTHGRGRASRLRAFKMAWYSLPITGWKNQHGWRPRLCFRLLMWFLKVTQKYDDKIEGNGYSLKETGSDTTD